jgi:hypothetical protein
MYLFTRTTRLGATHAMDGMEWAVAMTEKVNQITSLNIGLWSPILSPAIGTLTWGTFVESLSDIEDAEAKLMADSIYVDLANQGAQLSNGTLDDQVATVLSPLPADANPTHIAVVQSELANGHFERGVGAGLEIAAKATEIAGLDTVFLCRRPAPTPAARGSRGRRPSRSSRSRRPPSTPTRTSSSWSTAPVTASGRA